MHSPIMNDDTTFMSAIPAVDEHLGELASSLIQTLQQTGAESRETILEQIYHYFREKTWKQSSCKALLQVWLACALLLDEDLTSEACARTLHILRPLAQFCSQCGTPVFEDYAQLDVGTLVTRIAASMQSHADSITVQTSACALISRLAGCSSCQAPYSTDLFAAVGNAGAVQALAQAVISLQAQPSVPAVMVCASETLSALLSMTNGGQSSYGIELVVEAGGANLVTAARDLAQGQGNSNQHAFLLMVELACRPSATFQEAITISTAAIDTAHAITKSEHATQPQQYGNNVRIMWSISTLVDNLRGRQDVDKTALAAFAERSAGIAIAYLEKLELDHEFALVWVRFLASLVCCIAPQDARAPILTSPSTALFVATKVLSSAQSTVLQSTALCALWMLLRCCQPLDSNSRNDISFAVQESINSTLVKFAEPDILGTQPIDGACLIHGLASIHYLRMQKGALSPAQACLALANAVRVLSFGGGFNNEEWDESAITWSSLSAALRVTLDILLTDGTEALNAAYTADGLNLVHVLAEHGQSKCLKVVLDTAGESLDLLSRTKSGATALQLARQNKHTAAAVLLEEVTQRAAEVRQAALLEEIETADKDNKDDSSRKAKKKKSVTRSASFAAEQPDEKCQKTEATALDHHHQHAGGDVDASAVDTTAVDGAAHAAEQARVELRQRLEVEYELALEERRMELAKQQQQHLQSNNQETAMMANNDGNSDSSSAENPSTPRATLEGGLTSGGNKGDSASGGAGSGSNSNSGAEDDLMMLIGGATSPTAEVTIDAAIPAPAVVGISASFGSGGAGVLLGGEGSAMLRTTPSAGNMSPYTSPSIPLPNGGTSDLNSMAINTKYIGGGGGLGMLGAGADSTNVSSSVQREHSLFGSPSLTGSLFGTAGSYGSGSPGFSTGLLHSNSGGSGAYFTNEASAPGVQLPDALFIHHGLTTEENISNNSSNQHNASLLASLAGNNNNNHVVPQMNTVYGQRVPSTGTGSGSSDGDSDASPDPTRHLWIGNLGTRTPRAILKAVFEAHGIVEDVVTFPGRMYAFVNYCTTDEAIQATNVLQNQTVPELTGDRPLLLKYRPVKKAEMHLRSLVGGSMLDGSDIGSINGLVSSAVGGGHGFGSSGGLSALGGGNTFNSAPSAGGSGGGLRSPGLVGAVMMPGGVSNPMMMSSDLDGNCSDPSPRIWLGNIAPAATSKTLQAVLGRFGPLTDAAVFPARIGPLGYAFVKFEALEDAVRALETLNNTVVPPLSGSKQLKMRYKPAASGPAGREESMNDSTKSTTMPSRHLWLGNITQKPTEDIIFQAFSKFGRVDSARVFPAKAYAFVNFSDINAAVRAMTEMEGVCIPCLTGVKPLVMRFQQENQQQPTGPPPVLNPMLRASASLANIAGLASAFNNSHPMSRVQSESALALAASLNQLVPGCGGGGGGGGGPSSAGLSDDHPHGLVGVVPNNTSSGSTWNAEQAPQMHRSASFNLLNQTSAARGATTSAPSPFGPNVLGMNDPNTNAMGSASSSQLSAVLNNLAALQRAASVNTSHGAPAHHDIARLSTMLASQSLASSAHGASMQHQQQSSMRSATNGGLDGLLCPLSKQLMTDPVLAADGVTYHRPAISEWMASQNVSPVLQTPLRHGGLVPNHAVKDAVLGYLRMQLRVAA